MLHSVFVTVFVTERKPPVAVDSGFTSFPLRGNPAWTAVCIPIVFKLLSLLFPQELTFLSGFPFPSWFCRSSARYFVNHHLAEFAGGLGVWGLVCLFVCLSPG